MYSVRDYSMALMQSPRQDRPGSGRQHPASVCLLLSLFLTSFAGILDTLTL